MSAWWQRRLKSERGSGQGELKFIRRWNLSCERQAHFSTCSREARPPPPPTSDGGSAPCLLALVPPRPPMRGGLQGMPSLAMPDWVGVEP